MEARSVSLSRPPNVTCHLCYWLQGMDASDLLSASASAGGLDATQDLALDRKDSSSGGVSRSNSRFFNVLIDSDVVTLSPVRLYAHRTDTACTVLVELSFRVITKNC